MPSQDDWKISRRSGRENRSTTSSFGMHLLKATKLTLTGHRPPSNYYREKPFVTLTSGWQRLRSRGSPATLNKTFSTRLRHRRIGGGGGDLSVFQNRREAGCRFRATYPSEYYTPHRNSKKSAAHSPHENQRSIAAVTAASRRGEFFMAIRDKISGISSNFQNSRFSACRPQGECLWGSEGK